MASRQTAMKSKNDPTRTRADLTAARQGSAKRRDVRSAYVAVVRTFLCAAEPPPPAALGRWLEEVGMTSTDLATLGREAHTGLGDGEHLPWRIEALGALLREYHVVRHARVRRRTIRGLLRLH